MNTRSYEELIQIIGFDERFLYLILHGNIGDVTFGFNRYLNQNFYISKEWKEVRNKIIARDNACDLAVPGFEIYSRAIVHHINPITKNDLLHHDSCLLDPNNLITVSYDTHQAITYGNKNLLRAKWIERKPFDTCPWRQ
jgi:hypothetical protein